jgi:ABC-2 type transport system permease protein
MNAVVANDAAPRPKSSPLNAPFAWLLRREVWESKALWMVPAIVGGVLLVSALVAGLQVGDLRNFASDPDVARDIGKFDREGYVRLATAFQAGIAMAFYIAAVFVQFFYAADALYSDRRDRSVLFWKSLPVSDLQTVLSKLVIATVAVPLFAWAGAVVAQLAVGLVVTGKIAGLGVISLGEFWLPTTWLPGMGLTLYGAFAVAIWSVPLVTYLLLVSALAPRSPFMWASLIPMGLALAEKIIFRTHYVGQLFTERLLGALPAAFNGIEQRGMSVQIGRGFAGLDHVARPLAFFTDPSVWGGLAVGGLFFAAAVWARRYRDET